MNATTKNKLAEALRNLTATARTFRNVPKDEQEWGPLDDEALDAAFAALAEHDAAAALAEHDAARPGPYAGANEPTPDHVTVKAATDPVSRSAVTWAMVGPHIAAEFYGPRQSANAQFFADALNGRGGDAPRQNWEAPIVAVAQRARFVRGTGLAAALIQKTMAATVAALLDAADLTPADREALRKLYLDTLNQPDTRHERN